MNIKTLLEIQSELIAPKNQYNSFGEYKYRSCEDILEALKPLLKKYNAVIIFHDKIVEIGGRIYVEATAELHIDDDVISTVAYAREAENKKKMDQAQITGAASSYARKYALNGLFAIDDTKDADTQDNTQAQELPSKRGRVKRADYPMSKAKNVSEVAKKEPESTPEIRRDKKKSEVMLLLKGRGMEISEMRPYLNKEYKNAVATNSEQSWAMILKSLKKN